MKKHMIHLAGLTLAATLYALPVIAQQPPGALPHPAAVAATPPPPGHIARVEVESSDEGGAFARAGTALADAETNVRRIFASGDSSDHPLIISSSAPDEKSLATLDEDLNIMARVLDKSIDHGEEGDRKGPFGITMWATGGGRRPRNLYIDGYGAIFTLNVNIPLLAPPSKAQVEEKKEETSSTWEEARNDLYGRDEERRSFKRARGDRKASQPFDAERVESLKKDLIESLKNATHIRGLKNDDHVTIVVQGSDSGVRRAFKFGSKGEIEREDVFAFAVPGGGSGSHSVMTLRAKKSDIDAFAKGKTDLDDFRKKVSTSIYQTPGGGSGGMSMRLEQ